MTLYKAGVEIIECSYFDMKTPCSICEAKPAFRRTGKCAMHSVVPHDKSRENDWIDCYEGCIKHDPVARQRHQERSRTLEAKQERALKVAVELRPVSLPQLSKLTTKSRQPREKHTEIYSKLINSLIQSRGIVVYQMARDLEVSPSTLENRIHGRVNTYVGDYLAMLDYIGRWDNNYKQPLKPEEKRK